jgi:hypothetical protein
VRRTLVVSGAKYQVFIKPSDQLERYSARSLLGLRMLLIGEMHSMLDGLHKT